MSEVVYLLKLSFASIIDSTNFLNWTLQAERIQWIWDDYDRIPPRRNQFIDDAPIICPKAMAGWIRQRRVRLKLRRTIVRRQRMFRRQRQLRTTSTKLTFENSPDWQVVPY